MIFSDAQKLKHADIRLSKYGIYLPRRLATGILKKMPLLIIVFLHFAWILN
jgi:hypothetical protein